MALMKWHGVDIAGGGMSVLPMTRAEYEANKQALDASDLLIDITDEEPSIATADEIPYTASMNVKEALDSVCQINNPNMVETLTPIVPTLTNGTPYSDLGGCYYYKKGTKVVVHVALTLGQSSSTKTLFTLPVGYRPYEAIVDRVLSNVYNTENAVVAIYPNGTVTGITSNTLVAGEIEFDAFQ